MTGTNTESFTRTNARHIASKVAADLRQMRLLYGEPSEARIQAWITELVELLVDGYLDTVEYGFKRDGDFVLSLRYEVRSDGTIADTGTGGLYARADVAGLSVSSYLTHTDKWFALTSAAQKAVEDRLPFSRTAGSEPGHTSGYWEAGHSYASGGVGAARKMWRPL